MQSRRDHLQAYQFATGQLASALVNGDPGSGQNPMRRAALGTVFGAVITVLLAAGFGVFGLISPGGNTAWRQPDSIIVEEETGNRYLYFNGELHPVANYASALLAAGDGAQVRQVSRNSLAGVPHGVPVGIVGAPDVVPPATTLLSGAWTRCLQPGGTGSETVDFDPSGRTAPVLGGQWVLLTPPSGGDYLLWNGTKYPMSSRSALVALGMDNQIPITAPSDWLADLPTGTEVAPALIPLAGAPGPHVAGRAATVGQLFQTTIGGQNHYYVLRSDGIAPISATESALLSVSDGKGRPHLVGQADIAAAPVSSDRSLLNRIPDVLTASPLATNGEALCLEQTSAGNSVHTTVVVERGPAATGSGRALVPADRGVVAVDQTDLSLHGGIPRKYLIDDRGVKYPLADDGAAQALGYGSATTLALPTQALALLPQGPQLARATATAPVLPGGS
ncbi:type VII secretion protein EccB [Streptomyces mirabilis]